jgi:multidrug efflux system membrane fusion protein
VLVLPAQAVQTGQQGDYVFVVKPDMTVAVRLIKVARTVTGLTEIQQGLAEGETVVIDGQIRLAPGSKVYFKKSL